MNFYISDLHFGHENCLKFDNRPFKDLEEMQNVLVNNWNNVVSNGDHVYILGDMFWKNNEETWDVLSALKGNKHLILGNHDRIDVAHYRLYFAGFNEKIKNINDGEDKLVLSHYPIACWQGQEHTPGWIHLYGHIHSGRDNRPYEEYGELWSKRMNRPFLAANVGCMVDYMEYTPKTLEQIKKAKGWI